MKNLLKIVGLFIIFLILAFSLHMEVMTILDDRVGDVFQSISNETILSLLSAVGALGSTKGIIISLFLFLIIIAFLYKHFWQPLTLFVGVFLANVLNKFVKGLVERDRPIVSGHAVDGFSFPSGHAMVGLVLYGLIAYFIMNKIESKIGKFIVLLIVTVLLLLMAISRLTAGEHYFTDIIGGFIAGGILLVVLKLGYRLIVDRV